MGVVFIKRNTWIFIAILIITLTAGCSSTAKKDVQPVAGDMTQDVSQGATGNGAEGSPSSTGDETIQNPDSSTTGTGEDQDGVTEQFLQSASVDLDGDGVNEQVEAVQISLGTASPEGSKEVEGRLRIRSGNSERQIAFGRKNTVMSEVLSAMEFKDLDGDGATDIMVITPDNGASFSISGYFIYSFKKDKSFTFISDNDLADFIAGFNFSYKEGNTLSMENRAQNFTAGLTIEYDESQGISENYMMDYEKSAWIDPVPVDISESSRLALTVGAGGKPEIKVPLPVFGLATVDLIGEIDIYYTIDNNFTPVMKRFEVLDFNGMEMVKAGSCAIK